MFVLSLSACILPSANFVITLSSVLTLVVPTASVRTLESVAEKFGDGQIHADKGETKIFIYPGFKWKIVDHLITNFHLPESTLIMLVSSFCGIENTLNFYRVAVEENYRFYSFGDACLLL